MSSARPVAVFDSGVGGISVLRVLRQVMPAENYIYYGDSLHAPYGDRTKEQIIALCDGIAEKLLGMDAKCIVIACNTATSAAAAFLREKYPQIPVIGMEPAVKPAALSGEHPLVLVMATPVTIHGEKLSRLVERFESEADYLFLEAPGIVPFVEAGETDGHAGEAFRAYLKQLIGGALAQAQGRKIDVTVLGCTHFPFARELIREAFPYPVDIIDGARGTAEHTRHLLAERGMLNDAAEEGTVLLLNSDSSKTELEKKLLWTDSIQK